MKKATLIFAAIGIMFMANMNVNAQCPTGWTRPIQADYELQCTWHYEYCYFYDALTLNYYISITNLYADEPCWYLKHGGTWFQIRKRLRDSLLSNIIINLKNTVWNEIYIPQCPQNFHFWFINEPACYKEGYQGYLHKSEPCNKIPRPCDTARVVICWDYVYDDDENIVYDELGNPIIQHPITRYWDPAIYPNADYYVCQPFYVPLEPMCFDNCY